MTYAAPPARTELTDTAPNPTVSVFKAGIGKLHDFVSGLLGSSGNPEDALAAMKLLDSRQLLNLAPTFGVATNALTITFKDKDGVALASDNPGYVAQRSATLGNGGFNLRKVTSALALTISSGSTLGHTSARLCPIYIYLIDNAGSQEVAVAGTFQGESGIFSTTAEGGAGAADNADVMYSATSRSNVPGRLVAIAWSSQTTAGTWTSVPSEVKLPPFHLERVGEEVTYMGGTVPYGFYLEDGSNVNRAGDAAKLFGKIGTTHGSGNGTTTYTLPDSRRRVTVGSGGSGTGTLGNAVGNTGGEEAHALTSPENATHSHGVNDSAHAHGYSYQIIVGGPNIGSNNGFGTSSTSATTDPATTGISIQNSGSGTAHNNIQPSLVATKMIRWLGDI